jgi:hypothetical protein
MKKLFTSLFLLLTFVGFAMAQDIKNNPGSNHGNKFEQLGSILSTPKDCQRRARRKVLATTCRLRY